MLIVAAGDCRIDNRRYKDCFGVKAKMMTAEELERFTGLKFGGVCPFGIPEGVDIYLDESLRRFDVVFPAAGTAASAVRLTVPELERVTNAVRLASLMPLKNHIGLLPTKRVTMPE